MLTCCKQQRALEALFYRCYILFIDREYQQHYKECRQRVQVVAISRQVVTIQEGALLSLEFYQVYLPLSLVDMLHTIGGGFNSSWFPFLLVGCLFWAVCLPRLWYKPLMSFSLPFLGAFYFRKFGRVSSINWPSLRSQYASMPLNRGTQGNLRFLGKQTILPF